MTWLATLVPRYRPPVFWVILALKLVAGAVLASAVATEGFIPFVNYYIQSGFSNPYDAFASLGLVKAFPYPPAMLWIVTLPMLVVTPLLSADWTMVIIPHLITLRIPLLLADLLIYTVLCQWLVTKERQVLWLYWASPIVFYVSYYHGQLDLIPTALLILSVWLLARGRLLGSFVVLAVGLATKSHLLLVLPIYLIYLWKKPVPVRVIGSVMAVLIGVYLLLLSPYLLSPGFHRLVLLAEEQSRLWALSFSFPPGITVYVALAAYLILILRLAGYKRLTNDALLVFLALMFTILVVLVPPSPGWYVWAIPFLAFFFVKFSNAPLFAYVSFQVSYLLYFIFTTQSDVFAAWQLIQPAIASLPTPAAFLEGSGINSQIVATSLFTLTQTSLVMTAYWTYRAGIKSHLEKRLNEKSVFIGIGGDSGAGKSTLASQLVDLFGPANVLVVQGDDVHRWPRGHASWQVYTHLNPKGNRLHLDADNLMALRQGQTIKRSLYDHGTGRFTAPADLKPKRFVLIEGLHPFYLARTRPLYDLKIYLDPDPALRLEWKLARDMGERGHSAKAVKAQLRARRADSKKFIGPQGRFADLILRYRQGPRQPGLSLEILATNSIDLEPLVERTTEVPGLTVTHHYENDLEHQRLQFQGSVPAEQAQAIAYQLLPTVEELIGHRPRWQADYAGLTQLVVLYSYAYLSERQL